MNCRVPGLLRLRAAPPAVPTGFLHRPRLDDQLTAGAPGGVTLLSAGPGYGKTLTLASWARPGAATGPVAWLSMDETDNDLQVFWSDVLGALTLGDAVPTDSPLRQFLPAAGFGAPEVALIRSALAELPRAVVLVLDDFHQVTDPGVLASIGHLLDHQPPQLRLVLATRADPPLRLHRMRVNGDVTDIRAKDLAFTATEAAELFARHGMRLSGGQLATLLDRTQGWPAGLRLALMCLDQRDIDGGIARFTGSDRLVAEYLIEEVINQLPEPDREFLLTTCVAERLTSGLANALTGRGDAQSTLERLAAQNTLMVGLAGSSEWFSVHPLLRDLLLHRLSRDRGGRVAELHLCAARWFADHGDPLPAIRHASQAADWDEVGRLLAGPALPLNLTPAGASLVAALAPAAARAGVHPSTSTLLAAAVCHFHRHDYEAMARDVGAAAELLDGLPATDRPAALVLIALLQVVHARTRNPAGIIAAASRLLDQLDDTPRAQLPSAEHYRVIATNNVALGQLWSGDLEQAESTLTLLQTRCADAGLGLVELSVQAHLALLDAMYGRFPDAARRVEAGRRIAERRGWSSEPQALPLYAAESLTAIATNRLDAAQAGIEAGLTVSNGGSDICCRLALAIAAVEVQVARNDPIAARQAAGRLTELRAFAGALPPMLDRWCVVAQADAHLSAGDPQAAVDLLECGTGEPATGFAAALERVALAQALLMSHRPDDAFGLLEPDRTAVPPYRGPAVAGRVLAAVAAERLHRDTAALAAITTAIDQAHGVGLIAAFLPAGEPLAAALISRHRHVVARHLHFTAELMAAMPHTAPDRDRNPLDPAATDPIDPLTERERAVLGYLPTMYKSNEIAADLFVTINTVKTHQRSIYRKLGVATRRDAVDRARALRLL